MNLSFNVFKFLHKIYPAIILAIVLMTWVTSVQGESAIYPPGPSTPTLKSSQIWAPSCSMNPSKPLCRTARSFE